MDDRLLIHNVRLVDETTDKPNAALLINGGKIERLLSAEDAARLLQQEGGSLAAFDGKGLVLMPSFIDMHAHFRDPGLTQKEDIETGCLAAAAGGFGTLVLMPNTKPVVSSQEMAEINNNKARLFGRANVIQSVSITRDFDGTTVSHLEDIQRETVPLVTEDGHEVTDSAVMLQAMRIAAKKGIIVSCHCEDPFLAAAARPLRQQALALLNSADEGQAGDEARRQAADLLSQANTLLALAEDTATDRNIALAAEAGCHLHLCHVSTAHCFESVRRAKKAGQDITCEVTPHHLGLAGDTAPRIFHIVNPPLRSEADRQAVVDALLDGSADCIATDHAPHTAGDKAGGSPGFSGLETAFAVCHTTLVLGNNMPLTTLSRRMSATPAHLLHLEDRGTLAPGKRADLVLVNTEEKWIVEGESFASKGKYTPLEGETVTGSVQATFLNGNLVFQA